MRRKKDKETDKEIIDDEILKDERIRLEQMISLAMQEISKRNDADVMAEVEKDTLTFIDALGKYRQPEEAKEHVQPAIRGRVPDHKKKIKTYVLTYKAIGDTFTTDEICFTLGRKLGRKGYTRRVVSQNLNQLQKQGDIEFDAENHTWIVLKALNYKTVERAAIESLTSERGKGYINAKIISGLLGAEEADTLTRRIGLYLAQVAEKHGLKKEVKSKLGTIYYDKRPECINLAEEVLKWARDDNGNFRNQILVNEAYLNFEGKAKPAQVRQTLLKNGYKMDRRMSSPGSHRFIRAEIYDEYIMSTHAKI